MATAILRHLCLAFFLVVASGWTATPARAETRSTGTAFVVHSDGLLLTCFHVIKDAGRIEVRLNGKVYQALVVGTDPRRDFALLQVDASGLPALPWVKAETVELGEEVRAFGFPLTSALGSSLKVTRGTISGVEREANEPVFQIDSAVNPGNSGGPLVNERGEVVGVVVARFEEALGVGYVAPADAASPLLRGLPPLRSTEKRVRLEGPALVHHVSPSVALVTCVPLEETGKLPLPFKRDFPKSASAPPPAIAPAVAVAAPAEKPAALVEKPAAAATPTPAVKAPEPAVPAKVEPKPEVAATPPGEKPAVTPVPDPKSPTPPTVKLEPKGVVVPPPATQPLASEVTTPKPIPSANTTAKPETPAAPKPAPAGAVPAPQPETEKPAPKPTPAAKVPEIDVDAELRKIRASDPPEFPQPAAQAVADTLGAEWTITNATSAPLTILFRGAEKRAVVIEPGKKVTLMLMPGLYEVAGRLALDTISPFYGTQEFTRGGRYQSRFRIEAQ